MLLVWWCCQVEFLRLALFCNSLQTGETNGIYQRPLMQTEKSKPKGKQIMLETRFTEFPALSVDLRVRISLSASETDD